MFISTCVCTSSNRLTTHMRALISQCLRTYVREGHSRQLTQKKDSRTHIITHYLFCICNDNYNNIICFTIDLKMTSWFFCVFAPCGSMFTCGQRKRALLATLHKRGTRKQQNTTTCTPQVRAYLLCSHVRSRRRDTALHIMIARARVDALNPYTHHTHTHKRHIITAKHPLNEPARTSFCCAAPTSDERRRAPRMVVLLLPLLVGDRTALRVLSHGIYFRADRTKCVIWQLTVDFDGLKNETLAVAVCDSCRALQWKRFVRFARASNRVCVCGCYCACA